MHKVKFILIVWVLLISYSVSGQEKRPLNHDDYDSWESVSSEKISKNGSWVGYETNPQEGDGRIDFASPTNTASRYQISRGKNFIFSNEGNYAIGMIKPENEKVRRLKLKDTKKDDLPKDSVFIINLSDGGIEKFPKVKSFKTPNKEGEMLALHFEKATVKPAAEKDSVEKSEKPKKTTGTRLLVRSFDGSKSWEFKRVKDYGFSENGDFLYYVNAPEDTLKNESIYVVDMKTGESKMVDEGKNDYTRLTFSEDKKWLTYMATEDSVKAKKPYYDLYLYNIAKNATQKIADKNTAGILDNGMVSKNANPKFSKDGERLYFGTAPDYVTYAYEDDTTILKEERVSLDIWGWQDAEIQPMQIKQKEREQKKSLMASYNISNGKVTQLADREIENVVIDSKGKHKIALALDDKPYRRNYSWNIQIGRDVYLVDLENGNKELIQKDLKGYPSLSPEGKYVYWYSNSDSTWMAYNVKSKEKKNLGAGMDVIFYDEIHDSPSMPSSYGNAGWMKGDEAFLVYDKYDIWKIDPTGKNKPLNITKGMGRESQITFRRESVIEDEEFIDPKSELILSAFHEFSKKNGYFLGDITGKSTPRELIYTDHRYYSLKKAEKSNNLTVRRSTFQQNPEIFATNLQFEDLNQLSTTNPQQANINWGSVELVDYNTNDGTPMQGLLYKPENFDSQKKYPMMVYFYERNSDGLHNYRAPAPSASTINIPYFVSNEYVVFVPDIKYDLGLPGPSAYNSIMPGVHAVLAKGFVDKENVAIQGQSWGGYQVAYLITQTNMFKAAGAGAPVVNMTSAYGGIRWGTGMSRMFQYEQTQSRIGGTLWDKPSHYIENSPLFYADRVTTPVLIMHNDADGSVPWYQGIEMFMSLKRLNSPAWLLVYNDEDHNLVQRKNRKDLSVRLSQFFDHYLKDAPAPLWMTEGLPAVEKGKTLKYDLSE
ncbi:MAG TPA: prolyl oligopeptidase family serine peptidase [Anditalea sp.]|nr:prolyl oligopeptidase family serine peptidase [Anditalea sp.]